VNGKILRSGEFSNVWIQPAAGDAGGAIGCALFTWYQYNNSQRVVIDKKDSMQGAYLGPKFNNNYIESLLIKNNIKYQILTNEELPEKIADLIAKEKVIGWFQGRMEFGPRALGSRTIIGDARSFEMQKKINLKIKFRESFRPFAPSIRSENISEYFDIDCESPYMLLVADIKKNKQLEISNVQKKLMGFDLLKIARSKLPAITHVDFSARIQSVNRKTNRLYHEMLTQFYQKYGCPVVVNTSFNIRGEPIVCSPKDAYICFMRTEMDYLIIGNYLLDKKQQKINRDDINWDVEFELD